MSKQRVIVAPSVSPAQKVCKALPTVILTGNSATDDDATSRREMLCNIITQCIEDESHIINLNSTLERRLKAIAEAKANEAKLDEMTTIFKIKADKRIEIIVANSDLTSQQLIRARKHHTDSDKHIMIYGFGCTMGQRLTEDFRYDPVLKNMFAIQHATMGSRLTNFSQKIDCDGKVNWRGAVYAPEYNEQGKLVSVTHVDGCKVMTPNWASYITNKYDLVDNFDDMNAFFECVQRGPKIWVITLFEDKNTKEKRGPCTVNLLKGDVAKQWLLSAGRKALAHAKSLEEAKKTTSASSDSQNTQIEEELKRMKQEQAQAHASDARRKAEATLQERAKKRRVLMKEDSFVRESDAVNSDDDADEAGKKAKPGAGAGASAGAEGTGAGSGAEGTGSQSAV